MRSLIISRRYGKFVLQKILKHINCSLVSRVRLNVAADARVVPM